MGVANPGNGTSYLIKGFLALLAAGGLTLGIMNFSGHTLYDEISAPSTPASGKVAVYAKSDGKMYRKDDTGTEAELSGGQPGGSDTHVQYNNSSAFGGDAGLTYDATNDALTVTGGADAVHLTVKGHSTQTAATLLTETSAGVDRLWVGNADMYWYYSTTANDYIKFGSAGVLIGSSNALGGKYTLRIAGADEITIRTAANGGIGWGDNNNDLAAGANVTAFMRATQGVVKPMQGSSSVLDTAGWVQNSAGDLITAADQTVDSTTLANATSLVTVSIATTRKIAFEGYFPFTAGDTVADGIKMDFDQGTATATYFIADFSLMDGNAFVTLTNARTAAIATDTSVAATTNTDFVVRVSGNIVINGAGTFGFRFAKNADAGTGLTLKRGARLRLWDMP